MIIHNPRDYVLFTSKNDEKWEILPKATVEFTREQSLNMILPDEIIIIENDILLDDINT